MSREEALKQLKETQANKDIEIAHTNADNILCELLIELGYQDVVDAYNEVDKWYA